MILYSIYSTITNCGEHSVVANVESNEPRHCDFQQYGIWTSVDSDEHGQPPCKLRNSK